jgi:hypothetical protein
MVFLDCQPGDVIRVKAPEGDIVITLDVNDDSQVTFFISGPDSAQRSPGEVAKPKPRLRLVDPAD